MTALSQRTSESRITLTPVHRARFMAMQLGCALWSLWGAAAHATPALEAHLGRPDALAAQILAGQIQPNAYLRLDHLASATPLCVMVTNDAPSAVAATDWLLKNGADVNRDCRLNDMQYGLPLDQVISAIAYTLSRNEPARGEFLRAQTDRLLKLGAHTNQGNNTPEGVAREVVYWAKLDRDHQAYIAQWLKEERQKTAEMFRTIVGVVGGVAAAYAISKAANGSGISQVLTQPATGGNASSSGNLPPLLARAANAQRPPSAAAGAQASAGLPPLLAQAGAAGRTATATPSTVAAPTPTPAPASLPPLLAQAAASPSRPADTAAAAAGWYPSLCATHDVNETGPMARSPYGHPWARVSRAQQDSKLGRCETREALASRAQAAGTRRLAERGADIMDQRVACDLGKGGYTVAQYGWVCELYVKAKLPNGQWVNTDVFQSGD